MERTWKYADWLIFFFAAIFGMVIWFMPNDKANKDLQELKRVNAERREVLAKQQAAIREQQAHDKMVEEEGIVYLPTLTPEQMKKLQDSPQK
jgi:hypothetical protein